MAKKIRTLKQAIAQLSSSTEHWLKVKAVLEQEINDNQAIIALIDAKVKENETKMSKLN
jgi:hypothetical protein